MPLYEPVPLLLPDLLGRVHFEAVGGAGMSPVALCYAALGVPTSGCDRADSPVLGQLERAGVRVAVGHDAAHVSDIDTLVVSSAIRAENAELVAARRAGVRVWHRSTALGALMLERDGVAITGTHGKTTVSAMILGALVAAGVDPSGVIGATVAATGQSYRLGRGEIFVVEADESDGSYLQYPASTIVLTNIEADHLDNWGTADAYVAGFERLTRGEPVRQVILDGDDPGTAALAVRLADAPARVITVGAAPACDYRLTGLSQDGRQAHARLEVAGESHVLRLAVPGEYNLHNAALAFAAGRELGAPAEGLLDGLAAFRGASRRFQLVGEVRGLRVIDDYAHHPTEVGATLTAARSLVGAGRLVVCFQPHLYTRTRDFARPLGEALALADLVVVTDVFPAREDPLPGVTGELVAQAVAAAGAEVVYLADKSTLPEALAATVRPGDVVLTMGAGDIGQVGPALVRLKGGSADG